MPDYQKRELAGMVDVGSPGPLPADLQGLADESLADLDWTYEPLGYHGFGFFPITEPIVPEAVTQLQFRRALRHFDLYDDVMAFVESQDAETQEAFNFASMIRRDSPLLNGGANALLGSVEAGQATLDQVFLYADTVVE